MTWPGLIWRLVLGHLILLFAVTVVLKDDPIVRYSWRTIYVELAGILGDVKELRKEMKQEIKSLSD